MQEFYLGFACADPGIFVRGGGGSSLTKKSSDVFFFFFFFLSSAYFTEVKWSISKKSIIFNCSRGGPTFPGGSNCLFPIETHITCDFPGGWGPDPLSPPLDPHLLCISSLQCYSVLSTIAQALRKMSLKILVS